MHYNLYLRIAYIPTEYRKTSIVVVRRPLRSSQLNYAALDAYCILELFQYCAREAEKSGKNVYNIPEKVKYSIKIKLPLLVT